MGPLLRNRLTPRPCASYANFNSDLIGLCRVGGLRSEGMTVPSCHLYAFLIPGGYALTMATPESIVRLIGQICGKPFQRSRFDHPACGELVKT